MTSTHTRTHPHTRRERLSLTKQWQTIFRPIEVTTGDQEFPRNIWRLRLFHWHGTFFDYRESERLMFDTNFVTGRFVHERRLITCKPPKLRARHATGPLVFYYWSISMGFSVITIFNNFPPVGDWQCSLSNSTLNFPWYYYFELSCIITDNLSVIGQR